MVRLLAFYLLLTQTFVHVTVQAHNSVSTKNKNITNNSRIVEFANIYADELIKQFDQNLNQGVLKIELLDDALYAKIQAARIFIEKRGQIEQFSHFKILTVRDSLSYNQVVDEINSDSIQIFKMRNQIKKLEADRNILYPSVGRDGNVTGNTFPENVWSLTFDDGPKGQRTQKVVDNLYLHDMKASFFMLMNQANRFQKAVSYVVDNEMEIALHSYTHEDLNSVTEKVMDYEVTTAHKELEELTGKKINLFRLPYGSGLRNQALRQKISDQNLIHIFWNVDTLDWKDKDPESIMARTIKQMKATPNKSGIILFHDIHPQAVIASEMVMKYLKDHSKTVCTVGEVIKHLNGFTGNCLK